jgi:hypothetical protein
VKSDEWGLRHRKSDAVDASQIRTGTAQNSPKHADNTPDVIEATFEKCWGKSKLLIASRESPSPQ